MEFPFCHVDARSGIPELFTVFSVSKPGIVSILMGDSTMIHLFGTAIADIRSLVQAAAAFLFKVLTGLIVGGTGSAFDTAEDNLSAGICFLAMVSMDTEVSGIIKSAFMIPVREPVSLNLFGDSGRILA